MTGSNQSAVPNRLSQKQALLALLLCAEKPYQEAAQKVAARALAVIRWLEDMNWHAEAAMLVTKVHADPILSANMKKLGSESEIEIQDLISRMNVFFEWCVTKSDWQANQGAPLVEELWELITTHTA